MLKALALAFPIVLSGQSAARNRPAGCLRYGPDTVRVTGKLTRHIFYGAPGFGENPKTDEKEPGFYLELRAPICTVDAGDDVNVAKSGVRLVQILLDQRGYDRLRPFLGRTVTLRGVLGGAITGHHHAPVLLEPVQLIQIER